MLAKLHAAIALALLLFASAARAEQPPRNLFVIDVSESMMGQCSDGRCARVFPDVQRGLVEVTTRWLELPASISISTFYNQDDVVSERSFEIKGPGPEVMRIAQYIKSLTIRPPQEGARSTHLYGALAAVLDHQPHDPARTTNIYLLTDGRDNSPDPAAAKNAFIEKWRPRTGDWLFFIDLYPGGNPELQAICDDPANHCSYHPVDSSDNQAVAAAFCIPSIHLSPLELDFGNILAADGAQASLFVRVNPSCLGGNGAGFKIAKVTVDDFPDDSFAASVEPDRASTAGPLNLKLNLNRPAAELPRRDYHGELAIVPEDLRYLVLPSAKISFRFGGDLPDAVFTPPATRLGALRSKTRLVFKIEFPEGQGAVDYKVEFGRGFDRFSTDRKALEQVVFAADDGWEVEPARLPPGKYEFTLALIPRDVDLVLAGGKPAPEKLDFTFTVPLPSWLLALYVGVPILLLIALLVGLRAAIIKFLPPGNWIKMRLKAARLCPAELVGTLEPVEGIADLPAVLDGLRRADLGSDAGPFAGQIPGRISLRPEWRKGRDLVRIAAAPQSAVIRPYGSKDALPATGELLYHADRLVIGDKILDYTRPDGLERGMEDAEETMDIGDTDLGSTPGDES